MEILKLQDLCLDHIVNMTVQFGPLIDTNYPVLLHLHHIWDALHEYCHPANLGEALKQERLLTPVKSMPWARLLNQLKCDSREKVIHDHYIFLKILVASKHETIRLRKGKMGRSARSLLKLLTHSFLPTHDRVSTLTMDEGLEKYIDLIKEVIRRCPSLTVLKIYNYDSAPLLRAAKGCALKEVVVEGEKANLFSTEDFLRIFLGLETIDCYREFKNLFRTAVSFQLRFDIDYQEANNRALINLETYYEHNIRTISNPPWIDIETIEISTQKVEPEALLLGYMMLRNLKYIDVGSYAVFIRSLLFFNYLTLNRAFLIGPFPLRRMDIIQNDDGAFWSYMGIEVSYFDDISRVDIFEKQGSRSGFLYLLKSKINWENFRNITILKLTIMPYSFSSLVHFLHDQQFRYGITDFEVDTILLSHFEELTCILSTFPNLNTLRVSVVCQKTIGRHFSNPFHDKLTSVYLTLHEEASVSLVRYLTYFFPSIKYLKLIARACLFKPGFASVIESNLTHLEALHAFPCDQCEKCRSEKDNLDQDSGLQNIARSLSKRRKMILILETNFFRVSSRKINVLRLSGWNVV